MIRAKLFLFILLFFGSCCGSKEERLIPILNIGLTQYEVYKKEFYASWHNLPPPPPLHEKIANNNLIEAPDGRIYFYHFPMLHLCGMMIANRPDFEPYYRLVKDLDPSEVREVKLENVSGLIIEISALNEEKYIAIGIQGKASKNKVLLKFVRELYKKGIYNIWKIREVQPIESTLLQNRQKESY